MGKVRVVSYYLDLVFSTLIALELLLYCFNSDKFFQISGFFVSAFGAILFGSVAIILQSKHIKCTYILKCLVALMITMLISTLINIDNFDRGYFFSFIIIFSILMIIEITRASIRFQDFIIWSYICGGLIVVLFQIIFRIRYYEMTATRITIQLLDNPKIDPNYLATFLIAPIFLCLSLRHEEKRKKIRFLLTLFLGILLVGVLLTGSRGTFLSLGVGGLVSILIMNQGKINLKYMLLFSLSILIVGGLTLKFVPAETFQRLFGENYLVDLGNIRRLHLWGNAIRVILKSPIWGYGVSNSANVIGNIIGDYEPAHSTFLDILLQTGIIGMIGVGAYICKALKNKNPFLKALCISTVISSAFIGEETCFYFWFNLLLCVYYCKKKTINNTTLTTGINCAC